MFGYCDHVRYDHPHILAGQGTIGLEIVDQVPDVDAVVVPVGGGGLIAGVALAVKSLRPNVKIIVSLSVFLSSVLLPFTPLSSSSLLGPQPIHASVLLSFIPLSISVSSLCPHPVHPILPSIHRSSSRSSFGPHPVEHSVFLPFIHQPSYLSSLCSPSVHPSILIPFIPLPYSRSFSVLIPFNPLSYSCSFLCPSPVHPPVLLSFTPPSSPRPYIGLHLSFLLPFIPLSSSSSSLGPPPVHPSVPLPFIPVSPSCSPLIPFIARSFPVYHSVLHNVQHITCHT